jgi:osmotically inducible lipoprotein OsmB
MHKYLFVAALGLGSLGLTGCGTTNETLGTVGGAALGGAAGHAIGGGSALGTIGGAAVGGVIGHEVGEAADRR